MMCVFLQAERLFSEVRRIESYRVEGMEIYSTTLWHLQKDVALSALSKDLTDMDKNCPEVRATPAYKLHLSATRLSVSLSLCLSLIPCLSLCRPGV